MCIWQSLLRLPGLGILIKVGVFVSLCHEHKTDKWVGFGRRNRYSFGRTTCWRTDSEKCKRIERNCSLDNSLFSLSDNWSIPNRSAMQTAVPRISNCHYRAPDRVSQNAVDIWLQITADQSVARNRVSFSAAVTCSRQCWRKRVAQHSATERGSCSTQDFEPIWRDTETCLLSIAYKVGQANIAISLFVMGQFVIFLIVNQLKVFSSRNPKKRYSLFFWNWFS